MTNNARLDRRVLAWMSGLYVVLAAGACAWIAWRAGSDGFRALVGDGGPGAALGAGMAAAIVAFSVLGGRAFGWYRGMEEELRGVLGRLTVPQIALLALASGIGEELFFRGALQAVVGWAAAGLVFGLLHFPVRRALVAWTLLATALGLLFGWTADRTGGIIGVTVAHVGVNAVNLWRLCGRTGRPGPRLPMECRTPANPESP